MRKHILFSTRELLLTAIIFVSAAAIITGTILSTVTTTTTTNTPTTTVLAASEEEGEEKSNTPTTTKNTKQKTTTSTTTNDANEKSSLTTTPSGLPLPTTTQQPSTTTTSDSTVITPPFESKTTRTTNNNKEVTTQSLSSVRALQTNSIPPTRSYYDIIFKTGTTADIAKVDVLFPPGVDISQRVTVEASGIGRGSTTFGNGAITYNVDGSQIKSISKGTTIRLEFGNIINPLTGSFTVSVTTKKSDGTVIEGPATSSAIVNTQINTNAIADHAVTGSKVAGTSKLVFMQCTVSSSSSVIGQGFIDLNCSNPSVAAGDSAVGSKTDPGGCLDLYNTTPADGAVHFGFINECSSSQIFGTKTVSAIVFHPT